MGIPYVARSLNNPFAGTRSFTSPPLLSDPLDGGLGSRPDWYSLLFYDTSEYFQTVPV